jgi:integrase
MQQDWPICAVHDLKHTFGARFRKAGVRYEDHQQLLGHKNQSITMHYSAIQLNDLIKAANAVCDLEQAQTEVYLVG